VKVALIHNLPSGGAKRALHDQVRELARRGHQFVEFAPATADLTFCSIRDYVQSQQIFAFSPCGQVQRRIPALTPYLNALQGYCTLRRAERVYASIAGAVDEGVFDVAFVHDCRFSFKPYVLRCLRTPSVFFCHHADSLEKAEVRTHGFNAFKDVYYGPARRWYASMFARDEVRNVRSASSVLTNSLYTKQILRERYGVEAGVLYPGVDTERFRPATGVKGNYVLSVGALVPRKGHQFVVAALQRLPAVRRPPLVVAANDGEPDEERRVRQLADDLRVELQVRRITDDRELVQLYRGARVFVYAAEREPLGLAPLEAMACGTPVVAVAEGGVRETVVDNVTGWLVERDVDAFAACLGTLLGDSAARERMAEAGPEHVRASWSSHRMMDSLECALFRASLTF
jgi:glycosyltransferase involved in cell wall biosynthesis